MRPVETRTLRLPDRPESDVRMPPAEPVVPVEVAVSREQRAVTIRWQDGHQSLLPFDLLRRECPCALCGDLRAKRIETDGLSLTVLSTPVARPGEVQLVAVRPVGRYAISLAWSDGHDLGIYAYAFLRTLCPCPACRPDRVRPASAPPRAHPRTDRS